MSCTTIVGFATPFYADKQSEYQHKLLELIDEKKLRIVVDFGQTSEKGKFIGIESVIRGSHLLNKFQVFTIELAYYIFYLIQYLHSGQNIGKVMVKL